MVGFFFLFGATLKKYRVSKKQSLSLKSSKYVKMGTVPVLAIPLALTVVLLNNLNVLL